jgi:uncharacterized membrane protein
MIRSRAVHYLLCAGLFLAMLGGLAGGHIALAAQEGGSGSFSLSPNQEEPPPDVLELKCKYPVLRGVSGHAFEFQVEATYLGTKARVFDLTWDEPPQWTVSITGKYEDEEIESFTVETFQPIAPEFKIMFGPVAGYEPEPGEYKLTLTATSGEVTTTVELEAVVTARYDFRLLTATGLLSTEVTAGEDNHFSILVINNGSAPVEEISFISTKQEGWSITYTPERVESLGAGLMQEVDVVITPPKKTIAGDYAVTLRGEGQPDVFDTLDLRVTVSTPTVWGWVGVIIIVVVVAGLAVLFRRMGRR